MIDVAAVAQRMLTGIEAYFDDQGWDLPERRYLAPGSPDIIADDGDHLVVAFVSLTSGTTGPQGGVSNLSRAAGTQAPPRAVLAARLMRCIDPDVAPETASIHEDGARLMLDPGRLLTALFAWRQNELEPLNPNPLVDIGDVEVIGPLGGLAGHKAKVAISPVH